MSIVFMERKYYRQPVKERKNQITTFQKPKKLSDNETLERMGKHLSVEDMKEETVGMVQTHEKEIALASNLELLVKVEKDEKEKMLKQFEIQKYEQITKKPLFYVLSLRTTIVNQKTHMSI